VKRRGTRREAENPRKIFIKILKACEQERKRCSHTFKILFYKETATGSGINK